MIVTLLGFVSSITWYNPLTAGFPVIQNQWWTEEIGQTYQRLPNRAKDVVPPKLWNLATDSAGLSVSFKSNAQSITVRYSVTKAYDLAHMAKTGVSGIDLLAKVGEEWVSCLGTFSFGSNKIITYTFTGLDAGDKEFRLYFPLYNTIADLLIGVADGDTFYWVKKDERLPIVIYGSSIAQGACASRPILAWPSILQRKLDYPLVNMGYSGSCYMDQALDFVNEIDAKIYIIDCLPNISNETKDEIIKRYLNGVKKLREKRTAPIILCEHAGFSTAWHQAAKVNEIKKANEALAEAYKQLKDLGFKDLYYLTKENVGYDNDAWTDYIHPNNWGMIQSADAHLQKIEEVLRKMK